MDLTPNDVRNYEFSSQMRGYSKDEVDAFLDQVAGALEAAKQEQLKLSMEVESIRSQLSGLKQFEETIKSAAIDARRNADLTMANAKQEADMIMSKARQEAESLVNKKAQTLTEIENQITKLSLTKKSYLNKIRQMIQSHLEMIEEIDTSDIDHISGGKGQGLDITESKDVTTEHRESLAAKPQKPAKAEDEAIEQQASLQAVEEEDEGEIAEDLKEAIRSDEPEQEEQSEGVIDPELAAALENYKKAAAQTTLQQQPAAPPKASAPQPDQVTETNKRAEDIPDGFIAREAELPSDPTTDRMKVPSKPTARASMEHNAINPDAKPAPVDIASELDEVAAKFEEEMSKAEKS